MVTPERIPDHGSSPVTPEPPAPNLLVPWEPWHKAFFGNLAYTLLLRHESPLQLTSSPAPFWRDVFVNRPLPFRFLFDSYAGHVLVILAVYFVFSSPLLNRPPIPVVNPYANTTLQYYSVSEYLPPLRAAAKPARNPLKGKPAYARQEIISVPPEPDNSQQTIVTPDTHLLTKNVPIPNMMVWADRPSPMQPLSASAGLSQPKLILPPDIIAPPPEELPNSRRNFLHQPEVIQPAPENLPGIRRPAVTTADVIKPAPEKLPNSRAVTLVQPDVIKPAPDLAAGARSRVPSALAPSVIAPPPTPDNLRRSPGTINIAKLSPDVAAPKLQVPEQRATGALSSGGGSGSTAHQQAGKSAGVEPAKAVPSAPAMQGVGPTRAQGQMLALSVHPAEVNGPIEIPQGSRRGVFAATPEGQPGAPGTPDIPGGGSASNGHSGPGNSADGSPLEGIHIAPGASTPSGGAVVASPPPPKPAPQPEPSFKDRLLSAMRGAVATDVPRQPASPTPPNKNFPKIEDKVFGQKKYYSMILNMPNLTSSAGSWIIRFAELNPTKSPEAVSAPVATNKVDPAYPAEVMRDKVEGNVVLYAIIRSNGTVDSIRVLEAVDDRLGETAMQALARWHFRPGTKQGHPVDVEAVVQIPFRVTKLKW